MDAVFAHPAPAHDDKIARICPFFMAGFSLDPVRHDAESRDKDQAFAHITGVEQGLAKGGGHPALVAAVFYALDDPIQKASGVKGRF